MISKKIECYAIHRTNIAQNGCKVQCKECAEVQQNKRQNVPGSFASYYQPLFDHMSEQHGLTLLQGEMDEIIRVVNEMTGQPDLLAFEWPVKEGYEVVTRDGRKVEVYKFLGAKKPIAGIVVGNTGIDTWNESGSFQFDQETKSDLFLRRVEKKVWVVEGKDDYGNSHTTMCTSRDALYAYLEGIQTETTIYEATLKQINQK